MKTTVNKKVCFVFGTRPEAIKLAPLILEFQKQKNIETDICLTGQHKEMLSQVLCDFDIKESVNLNLMQENQTLTGFASLAIKSIDAYLQSSKPDMVFVHGDTSTALYGALAAFYNKIPVAHIEAGLRTHNKYSPFPEEMNRTLVGKIAELHFAPTDLSKQNLLQENIDPNAIFVTGNTVIDALLLMVKVQEGKSHKIEGLPDGLIASERKMVLITMHRRENFGEGLEKICQAISELATKFPDHYFVYPVHPNPNVIDNVKKYLSGKDNVYLISPQEYSKFVFLMNRSYLILTDSGGVQEEAPGLGKPILVLRENTERPEALEAGTVKLVGTNSKLIVDTATELLLNISSYNKMAESVNPYGDGKACNRIVDIVLKKLNA